jgi:hypothetical protein
MRSKVIAWFAGYVVCAAADFCALRVTVEVPEGHPARVGVAVMPRMEREEVARSTGEGGVVEFSGLVASSTDERGVVEFCDLGLGLFDVVVGGNLCGQVIVRYLYLTWPETRELKVVYGNCHFHFPDSGCLLLLRVRSSNGYPVPGASLLSPSRSSTLTSDRFGRIITRIPWRTRLTGILIKEGFGRIPVDTGCSPETGAHEAVIELPPLR